MNTISSVNSANLVNQYTRHQNPKSSTSKTSDKDFKNETGFSIRKTVDFADDGIYTPKSNKPEASTEITSMLRRQTEQLIKTVLDTIQTQGRYNSITESGHLKSENVVVSLKDHIMSDGELNPADKANKAETIADDGMWGIEAVSDRLIESAMKITNGDESKYKIMKSSIEAGFKAAEAMWGGELPEISYKSFETAMSKLETAFNQAETA